MSQREGTDGLFGAELDSSDFNYAYIIRLDVDQDPLFAWTGYGELSFGANETGDPALDGETFSGITHLVAEIGTVTDQRGGSPSLEIKLPGIDLEDEAMQQVVFDRRKWQRRRGRVWFVMLDDEGNPIGAPVRLKSGYMDQMTVKETDSGVGTVSCIIEGQQAYAGEGSGTRWSEQEELDATDNSQRYVWQLANMTPGMGQANLIPGASGGYGGGGIPSYKSGGGGGGGRGGGRSYPGIRGIQEY